MASVATLNPPRPCARPTRNDFPPRLLASAKLEKQAFAMSPILRTLFFTAVGFFSHWSLMKELGGGVAASKNAMVSVKDAPGAFYLIVFCKTAFVSFAIAVILNAFGAIGDPTSRLECSCEEGPLA
jgi:hypothetical protein